MRLQVVAQVPEHDRHIGLGLRGIVEGDRALGAHVPPRAKGVGECPLDEPDGREVERALGLGDHQQTVDQLDALARKENASLDELLVLDPLPPPDLKMLFPHVRRI